MDTFIISSLPSLCWRHCKWQGPFAPRTLLRFIATTDPAATLSSSADFPVSPVIRPTLLRRFRAGTRRASPVAQHVLVTVLSLPPRQGEQPHRSDFGCSRRLRPHVAGSALGDIHFRGHNTFTSVIQTTGTPAGLSPAEHASLRWTHNVACGFPAPRSSAVDPQLSLLSVQVSFPWSADLLLE